MGQQPEDSIPSAGTVTDNLEAGRSVGDELVSCQRMQFVINKTNIESPITDPLAEVLNGVARECTGEAAADVDRFLKLSRCSLQHWLPTTASAVPWLKPSIC